MKISDVQKGSSYNYSKSTGPIVFTGTVRDVKSLQSWFFATQDGFTIFLSRSEVESLTEI